MRPIKKIVCCCSSGIGSSVMVEMNLQRALANLQIRGVTTGHTSLSEIGAEKADLFVTGRDLAPQMKDFKRVIVIRDMVSADEFADKLTRALESTEKRFRIE